VRAGNGDAFKADFNPQAWGQRFPCQKVQKTEKIVVVLVQTIDNLLLLIEPGNFSRVHREKN